MSELLPQWEPVGGRYAPDGYRAAGFEGVVYRLTFNADAATWSLWPEYDPAAVETFEHLGGFRHFDWAGDRIMTPPDERSRT